MITREFNQKLINKFNIHSINLFRSELIVLYHFCFFVNSGFVNCSNGRNPTITMFSMCPIQNIQITIPLRRLEFVTLSLTFVIYEQRTQVMSNRNHRYHQKGKP